MPHPNDRSRRHARSASFTLIELLTVLAIIIMFLGVSVPVVTAISGNRGLQGGALDVQSALQQARSTAITERCYATVVFKRIARTQTAPEHYRVRLTGFGQAINIDLPPTVTVGGEAVEVKSDEVVSTGMPVHSYPIIFRPDGALVQTVRQGDDTVFLTDSSNDRIIILRDSSSEPFTDLEKSYLGNTARFKNGVFDMYDPPDGFVQTGLPPETAKQTDWNLNGVADRQVYVQIQPYTGRTFINEKYPDQWVGD